MARQVSRPMLQVGESQELKGKHGMGFAQVSFEEEESEWEHNVENMRTLPSCRGPIGWFIPKRSVLSMSSRVATPWPPSSGDSKLKIT
jgi:hypothetical protein